MHSVTGPALRSCGLYPGSVNPTLRSNLPRVSSSSEHSRLIITVTATWAHREDLLEGVSSAPDQCFRKTVVSAPALSVSQVAPISSVVFNSSC